MDPERSSVNMVLNSQHREQRLLKHLKELYFLPIFSHYAFSVPSENIWFLDVFIG